MNGRNVVVLENKNLKELNPLDAGEEKCDSGYSFGPHIRDYWLIHYVKSGCGEFVKNGKTYAVKRGSAFLICPDEVCTYTADKQNPWHYIWIGFTGSYAKKFEQLGAVFEADEKIFDDISRAGEYGICKSEYLSGELFLLYTSLFSQNEEKESYVRQACGYIDANYLSDIKICDIAKIIGVERTYLAKIFKREKHMSMQQYLAKVRISKAKRLLKAGYTVSEAAYMSGYNDACNFSKMFKKNTGTSPARVKK